MKITVYSPNVRKNIELFKRVVERQSLMQNREMRELAAFINCATGDFSFSQDVAKNSEWKAVRLQINDQGALEVSDSAQDNLFQYTDMQQAAYQVMIETIGKLNQVLEHAGALFDSNRIFREFQNLEIEFSKDIVHEAWHQIDRIESELLLQKHPIGTFLFRKDDFAVILEQQLRLNSPSSIKCITLTFLGPKKKVSDFTLVRKDGNWVIYDDDPSLSSPSYPTIYALLESLKHLLKIPLFH